MTWAGRRAVPVEGEHGLKAAAIQKLAALDPDRIVYRMVFADQIVPAADIVAVQGLPVRWLTCHTCDH